MEYNENVLETHRQAERLVWWMIQQGFLRANHLCTRCMVPMRFERDKHAGSDKYCWRCTRSDCRQRCSVREGSFFANSRLSLRKQLRLIINFVADSSAKSTADRTGIGRNTVTAYFDRIRARYHHQMVTNPINFNFGFEYEVDELEIKAVRVPHVGHIRQCVAGICERQTGQVMFYRVDDRSRLSLVPPIENAVPQGSFIYSDDWKSYRSLGQLGYFHHHVNHSAGEYARIDYDGFVPLHVHINTLEGLNGVVRARLRNRSRRTIERIDIVLGEIMYRHSGRSLYAPVKI